MSKNYALIGVEGNHDQAFIQRILQKLFGLTKFDGKISELDPFWRKFIPVYPKNGDLYKRLDMPSILFQDTLSVAIYVGEGSKLSNNLTAKFADDEKTLTQLSAFAIVADADRKSPDTIAQDYSKAFREYFSDFPQQPGIVDQGMPRSGIYILPNNINEGVLDSLLKECGKIAYPKHIEEAEKYLNSFSEEEIQWNNFDRDKALIATVASVLKPGKTNTASISDNKWVSKKTYEVITELQDFVTFTKDLLAVESVI